MPNTATIKRCKVRILHTRMIGKNLYQIDLETGGFKNLICSYVLKGTKVTLVESGPTSSVPKLVEGLKELKVNFDDVEYVAVTHVHLDHGGGAGTLLKFFQTQKYSCIQEACRIWLTQHGSGNRLSRFWGM